MIVFAHTKSALVQIKGSGVKRGGGGGFRPPVHLNLLVQIGKKIKKSSASSCRNFDQSLSFLLEEKVLRKICVGIDSFLEEK